MANQIDYENLPSHIAIIMDGNGRWAKKRFLNKRAGHKAGAEALRKLSRECEKIGIKHLTVYAFSTENWKRSEDEVSSLMDLLKNYIQQYIDDVDKHNMRLTVIGDCSLLDKELNEKIIFLEETTKNKTGLRLNIALNYGSRDEIVRATKKLCQEVKQGLDIESIDEKMFSEFLDTRGIPEPELLIRTSGELRISNFLLWQLAYTEFFFSDRLWPDFTINDLLEAVATYQSRDRRFGGR